MAESISTLYFMQISALRMSFQPSPAQCTYLEVFNVYDLFNVFNGHHISKVYAHKMQSVYLVLVNLIKQHSPSLLGNIQHTSKNYLRHLKLQ